METKKKRKSPVTSKGYTALYAFRCKPEDKAKFKEKHGEKAEDAIRKFLKRNS